MTFTLYRNNFHNCYHLIISAMLKRGGYDLERIWNQAGLKFEVEHGCPKLSPYYQDTMGQLETLGARFEQVSFTDLEAAKAAVHGGLALERSVGLMVDIFELPYCMYYQEMHELHGIEVLSYADGEYEICDHYYQFHGKVAQQDIENAISSCFAHFEPDGWVCFYLQQQAEVGLEAPFEQVVQVVAQNTAAMEGQALFELAGCDPQHLGMQAIVRFQEQLPAVFAQADPKPMLDDLYKVVKEICDSRHHYHCFLKGAGCEELAEQVHEASQCWAVVANMLLRALVTEQFETMLQRVMQRMERVYQQEKICLEQARVFLEAATVAQ